MCMYRIATKSAAGRDEKQRESAKKKRVCIIIISIGI